ncbi:extensin family protein [Alteraurantiacibacter aquimixticola]|uniref:Extensin family protein n=1 Tax=Alteraurantiacibacter aquimixticola TaxID=2489173 RepID=A0A4T3EZJ6_9SPHN|nr:extensin family protein [Alteraurantiacibacter aquimixticola]TIX50192.1 extensin family protein [Alteraurantiacibacter aquimixticola]
MKFSRRIGRFRLDRIVILILLLAAGALAMRGWLQENPQHNPWAPLEIAHPIGWATASKLDGLRSDATACRAVLDRGGVAYSGLPPSGEGECSRPDRTVLTGGSLAPADPQMTCIVATAYEVWMRHTVQPAAQEIFGSEVRQVQHLGTYNCRRIGGGDAGSWSEHASGNAIDIAAFVLEDGRRVSVLGDWEGEDAEAQFLRRVRDGACGTYATVLSPDYNFAHADHFHFDQADRMIGGVCR